MAYKAQADHTARYFGSFERGTQQLIKTVLGHNQVEAGIDSHILHLGINLRRSEAVIEAAERLFDSEPLYLFWADWLNLVLLECLKPYHQESFDHLMRLRLILREIKNTMPNGSLNGIPDYGNQEFIDLRDSGFTISDEDWQCLFHAFWYHDLAKMAYPVEFWKTPGKLSPDQLADLEAHARLFYNIGEMFNVPEIVVALSVLHHYPNKQYPHNGTVKRLSHHLELSHFCNLLVFLVHCDIYEANTGNRGYRAKPFEHDQAMSNVKQEMNGTSKAFLPILQATFEQRAMRGGEKAICAV